jgi:hypothetical protein
LFLFINFEVNLHRLIMLLPNNLVERLQSHFDEIFELLIGSKQRLVLPT